MTRRSLILIFLFVLLHQADIRAQKSWSLEECILYALEHNISLKKKAIQNERAVLDLQQARLNPIPNLSSGLTETFRVGRTVDPLTYEFNTRNSVGTSLTFSGSADLFQGFKQLNTIKAQRFLLDQSLQELEKARMDLGLAITKLYLQILYQEEWVSMAREQSNLSKEQVGKTNLLVAAGALNQGDKLEMEAQHARDELMVTQAENDLELAHLDLIQLLDLKDTDSFQIKKPMVSAVVKADALQPAGSMFSLAYEAFPSIQSAQMGLKAREHSLLAAQGERWPSLRMTTLWGTGYSDRITDLQTGNVMRFADQLGYTSSATIHFTLDIPLFNGLSRQNRVRYARLDLLDAQLDVELAGNELFKEIQQVRTEAETAFKLYQTTERTLIALKEAYRYALQRHNLGMLTAVDLNMAKKEVSDAESAWLQSRYRYLFSLKILDFYQGLPLKLE